MVVVSWKPVIPAKVGSLCSCPVRLLAMDAHRVFMHAAVGDVMCDTSDGSPAVADCQQLALKYAAQPDQLYSNTNPAHSQCTTLPERYGDCQVDLCSGGSKDWPGHTGLTLTPTISGTDTSTAHCQMFIRLACRSPGLVTWSDVVQVLLSQTTYKPWQVGAARRRHASSQARQPLSAVADTMSSTIASRRIHMLTSARAPMAITLTAATQEILRQAAFSKTTPQYSPPTAAIHASDCRSPKITTTIHMIAPSKSRVLVTRKGLSRY